VGIYRHTGRVHAHIAGGAKVSHPSIQLGSPCDSAIVGVRPEGYNNRTFSAVVEVKVKYCGLRVTAIRKGCPGYPIVELDKD